MRAARLNRQLSKAHAPVDGVRECCHRVDGQQSFRTKLTSPLEHNTDSSTDIPMHDRWVSQVRRCIAVTPEVPATAHIPGHSTTPDATNTGHCLFKIVEHCDPSSEG